MESVYIKTIFENNIQKLYFTYRLHPTEIQFLKHIISYSPDVINDIGIVLNQITNNNSKIMIQHIPKMILDIGEIYKTKLLDCNTSENIHLDNLLEFTIISIFESPKIASLPKNDNCIDDVISNCIRLIRLIKTHDKDVNDRCNLWWNIFS